MSKIARKGIAIVATVIASAALAGAGPGCKDEPAANPGPGATPSTAAKAPDLSNPKSTAVAFARAIQSNDMAAIRAASTGNDEQYRMIEAMSQLMYAFKNYESAAVARFGEAGKGKAAMPDIVAEAEAAEIKIDGDTATASNKPDAKDPMKLVKKDGQWKVDLVSIPADSKRMADNAPGMTKALDETATDIKAGKFASPEEAHQALGIRMQAGGVPG